MKVRRPSSQGVLLATIFVSMLVHVAIAGVLPAYRAERADEDTFETIELLMDPPAPVVEVAPEVPPPPAQAAVQPGTLATNPIQRPLPENPVAPSETPSTPPTQVIAIDSPSTPTSTDVVVQPPAGIRLDPRAAALASLGQTGPTRIAPQAQAGPSETTSERDARLSQELSSHLREVANFQAHLTTRPTPEPRVLSDGRVSFEGVGLTMIFDPRTGDVSFTDRPGFQYEGFGGGASGRQGLTFNFDLNDSMHRRHGSDPRQAERRWLMNRTQQYRDSAQDAAVAGQSEMASRGVRGRLQRILDDEARPIATRRAQIFRTWDQCSESDAGAAARRTVIAFIRERMPSGSPNGFTAGEIAAMNGRRQSTEPFAPY